MPATSRSVILVGVAAATATLLFYILQAAEHPDRVRTQSIIYKVSYFTWQTESGLSLHSPSVTALALLSFVAWTPSSKVKATLALILSLAVSVGLDVVFMLYAAHHLIHSTTLFSLASLALAAPAFTWAAFFWLVTSQGEELYEKAAWAIPELVRIYNSRPRLPVGPLAFP